jgi:acetyltransferase-like isoleucine patch superfamily enzyme
MAPSSSISHRDLRLGRHVYVGARVVIYQAAAGGPVQIGDDVHINQDCILESGQGGRISIGSGSRIQPRCQFAAYRGDIVIGSDVQIAPNCAFYPYDHEFAAGVPIKLQGLRSRSGIVVGDDAWLGVGVIVLDGARIGAGAVIGAGSLVRSVIPDNAIAAGNPARVVGHRHPAVADDG